MVYCKILVYVLLPLTILFRQARPLPQNALTEIDVLHYEARIEPNLGNGTIQGKVSIQFLQKLGTKQMVELSRGGLTVDSVFVGNQAIPFDIANGSLRFGIKSVLSPQEVNEVVIFYHGKPRKGMRFFPKAQQVYTVFFTSEWLICNDNPADRATLQLNLITPQKFLTVCNGHLNKQTPLNDGKIDYEWRIETAVPTYTFGFVAGRFNRYVDKVGDTKLQYFGDNYSTAELAKIFEETGEILKFFENRSGIPYPGTTFSLILAEGNVSQEMAGFAVLRNSYGSQVLTNATEINLSAHELAHQWWGNQITCKNWGHFWLNEGFAVFMSSAYKEFRFGREEYLKDIEVYFKAYQKVVDKGNDKPLVFPDWSNPTSDDRVLVYYKGAYVLHLLREKLGEKAFWKAIRTYTESYFGKPVVSADLQHVMEQVSGRDLNKFFAKWVY